MEKREIAVNNLKELCVMPECVNAFKRGDVWTSTQGILFEADEQQKQKIEELEKNGDVVWHIIHGRYNICGDEFNMDAYLLVTQEDEEFVASTSLEASGEGWYQAFAYVHNTDYPDMSEYGSVGVKKLCGGIVRVY